MISFLYKQKQLKFVTTTQEKMKIMFQIYYSLFSKILMNDIENFNYSSSIKANVSLTNREIKRVIYKTTSNKISRHIDYMNKIMRKLVDDASKQMRSLFEKCFQKRIQSIQFKNATTIILRKSQKNYSNSKTFKFIALLNTLNKILKSIVSKRLRNVLEQYDLLSNTQMNVRKHKLINIALQLITKKIHIIWSDKKKVISLLNLNEKNVFNNVTHRKLLHDIRKRKVFELLFKFVNVFLKNKRTTITIEDHTTTKRRVNVNISQSLSLSSMLYLFYNANLLETYDDIKLWINFIEFVNDDNILTYEKSIERNCKVLNEIYNKCEQWAQTHDTKFSKLKHELIHFSKTFKRFNMSVNVTLTRHQIESKTNVKILKIQLNFKFKWVFHIRQIETKLIIK